MNSFFAPMYEGFGLDFLERFLYINYFSDSMNNDGGYTIVGFFMIFSSLIMMGIYYYLIASYGKYFKIIYWFIWLLIIALINFLVANHYSQEIIINNSLDYIFSEYFIFLLTNVFWSIIFSFGFSLLLKIKSIKGSRTPF